MKIGLCMLFLVFFAAEASADPIRIAQIKTVSGTATIARGGERIAARVGDPLYESDVIETGPDGTIGVTFIDNTVFSTGPNTQVALEQFAFDSGNFRGHMLADMRRGTLTVVSGDITRSSPGALKIKTPNGVLGVRGTRFAVKVY